MAECGLSAWRQLTTQNGHCTAPPCPKRQRGLLKGLLEPVVLASTKTSPVALKDECDAFACEATAESTPQFHPSSVMRQIRTSTDFPQPFITLAEELPLNVALSLVSTVATH